MVKRLTLDLGSGLDLKVVRSGPVVGSVLGVKPVKEKMIPSFGSATYQEHDIKSLCTLARLLQNGNPVAYTTELK